MRRKGLKRNAPTELKQLLGKLQKVEQEYKLYRRERTSHRKEHKEVFNFQTRITNHITKLKNKERLLTRMLGMYEDNDNLLPGMICRR